MEETLKLKKIVVALAATSLIAQMSLAPEVEPR